MKAIFRWAAVLVIAASTPALAQDRTTPARPLNAGEWITHQDYPLSAIRAGEEGTVSFALTVTPEGSVPGCEVTGGTAPDTLKLLTCELIRQRARFEPARDDQGRASGATYDGTVVWQIPEGEAVSNPVLEEGTWVMSFILETDGSISSCEFSSPEYTPSPPDCGFPADKRLAPVLDENGEPVRKRIRTTTTVVHEDPED